MLSLPKHGILNNSYVRDAAYTILFGILSAVLSKVQFHIPGVGDSNLREIPLLISLFHFSNPFFIIGVNLFTLIGSPAEIPYWAVLSVHLLPLFIARVSFKLLERTQKSNIIIGVAWMAVTIAYYMLFLLPLVIVSLHIFSAYNDKTFWESYFSIVPSIRFEVVTSALVSGFYLMQLEIRKTLKHNNRDLEKIVESRTTELTSANNELLSLNEELKASNEGIKELNENLEKMVKERTDKINDQLNQLMKYAHMNSHEVRAPLARMLGLLQLIRREDDADLMKDLLGKLYDSSTELDMVIKEMNRLLEKEIDRNEN